MSELNLEGFICPECLKVLSSVTHLEAHFRAKHINVPKPKVNRTETVNPTNLNDSLGIYNNSFWNSQSGFSNLLYRSHTEQFRKMRSSYVGPKAIESNKTLLRLDKLLVSEINGSDNRREYEKSVVTWARDEDVPLCPSCGKYFNMMLLRRKHHCRLCGSIMCQTCSMFITATFSTALLKSFRSSVVDKKDDHVLFFGTSDNFELLTQQCTSEDEHRVKVCLYCVSVLKRVTQEVTRKLASTDTEILYKQLVKKMDEVREIKPVFLRAVDCINKGESDFSFGETTDLRHQLLKCYEVIEGLSKQIINCGKDKDHANGGYGAEYKLAVAIRKGAQLFLQENLYALQSLPSREQYLMRKETRKTEIVRKIERDKLEAASIYQQNGANNGSLRSTPSVSPERGFKGRPNVRSKGAGFLPSASVVDEKTAKELENDPILIQIRQVQGYISQARSAGKNDEVQMLTENLKQLQELLGPQMQA